MDTLVRLEKFETAEMILQKSCKLYPNRLNFYRKLIEITCKTQNWFFLVNQAIFFIDQSNNLDTSLQEESFLLRLLDRLITILIKNQKWFEIEQLLNALKAKKSSNLRVQLWSAHLTYQQGLDKKAETICYRLLEKSSGDDDLIHIQLARYAWLRFDLDKALEQTNAIQLHSSKFYQESVVLRYRVLIRQRKLQQARAELKQLMSQQPNKADGYRFLTELLLFSEEKNYREVIRICSQAYDKGIESEDLICHHSLALSAVGEADKAFSLTQKYLIDKPTSNLIKITQAQISNSLEGEARQPLKFINECLLSGNFAPITSTSPTQQINIQYLQCKPGYFVDSNELASVIMTTYQQEQWLPVAISSILNQTYRNIELIIIDDCSHDSTWTYLQELSKSESRIRIFKLQKNSGTYLARNHALEQANGDYIFFLDSDDWMHPQSIERRIDIIKKSEVVCVTTSVFRVTQDSQIEFRPVKPLNQSATTLGFQRDAILNKIGYFDAVRANADVEYIQRIRAVLGPQKLKQIEFPLLVASRHDASLTGGGNLALSWYGPNESRTPYIAAWRQWHRHLHAHPDEGYLPHPLDYRRFMAPDSLLD